MLLVYQLDWIKIVDFLLIAKFWACVLFFCSPSMISSIKWFHRIMQIIFNQEIGVYLVIRSYLIPLYKSLKARVLTCTISLLQLLLFSVCIVLPTPQSNWFSLCLISQLKSLSISDQSPIITILKYQIQFC